MRAAIIDSILAKDTITIDQLHQQLLQRKHKTHKHHNSIDNTQHNKEIVVKSPFYQRINHKPDCGCPYHKRKNYKPNNLKRLKTQPNEEQIRNTIGHDGDQISNKNSDDLYNRLMKEHYENPDNISQKYKQYYFQYLRTLPQFSKFNRHNKLDCHNQLFQELLKSRFIILSEHPKSEKDKKIQNRSQKSMKTSKTENNINFDKNKDKKQDVQYTQQFGIGGSNKDNCFKHKKIAFRETGKTLELISQQYMKGKHDQTKKKKAKFCQHRSSFFGLVDDQQVLKQLCLKFMDYNQTSYRQGQLIVKKLAQLNADVYKQIIEQMQEDIITNAVKVKNLSNQQAHILIKIVLSKIKDETQALKNKTSQYKSKNALIDELCNKYGWMQSQQVMQLKQFWTLRRQKKKSDELRRSSLLNESRQFKSRHNLLNDKQKHKHKNILQRQYTQIKSDRSNKGLFKSKGQINEQLQYKTGKQSKISHFYRKQTNQKGQSQIQIQQFKLNHTKSSLKKSYIHKKKKNLIKEIEKDTSQINKSGRQKKIQFPLRKDTFYFNEDGQEQAKQRRQQQQQAKRKQEQQKNDRNQSLFIYLRNHVLNHMQTHKHFVKKFQNYLIQSNCQTIIIGFGESLITKRRKIRAIQQFLKDDQFAQSDYYKDLQKYIDIFQEYCDLVINKRNLYKRMDLRRNTKNLTIENYQKDTQNKEMIEQNNEITTLLQDLKKDRELKFIDIHLLHKKQDPKQQLIIKIPQYISKKQKTKVIIHPQSINHFNKQKMVSFPQERPKQSNFVQKQMAQKVNLIFQDLKYHQQCQFQPKTALKVKKQPIVNEKITKWANLLTKVQKLQ